MEEVARALAAFRPQRTIEAPGTVDGGDVLVVGRAIFVGRSTRTNAEGVAQLARIVEPHGYSVQAVDVSSCLHLKSAATAVALGTVLLNPDWVDARAFRAFELIEVDPAEPLAANALDVAGTLVYAAAFPRTRARLERSGRAVRVIDMSELAKAEGAVTCCSLVFAADASRASRPD